MNKTGPPQGKINAIDQGSAYRQISTAAHLIAVELWVGGSEQSVPCENGVRSGHEHHSLVIKILGRRKERMYTLVLVAWLLRPQTTTTSLEAASVLF